MSTCVSRKLPRVSNALVQATLGVVPPISGHLPLLGQGGGVCLGLVVNLSCAADAPPCKPHPARSRISYGIWRTDALGTRLGSWSSSDLPGPPLPHRNPPGRAPLAPRRIVPSPPSPVSPPKHHPRPTYPPGLCDVSYEVTRRCSVTTVAS